MSKVLDFVADTAQADYMAEAKELLAGRKYHIVTYGCQMNNHDSEKIAGMLQRIGMTAAAGVDDADLVLFNTCCVREHAENRVYGNVGALINQKRLNPSLIVGVCGCMMQQEKAAEKLLSKLRHVDLAFGTHNLHELPEMLVNVIRSDRRYCRVTAPEDTIVEGVPVLREESVSAWVTIMYGCDNYCSYCIVPYVRGHERSRGPEKIVEEVRALVAGGVREVTLLGQNVNSYGAGTALNFPKLLRRIEAEAPGLARIRFMTSHPKDLSDELIETMAASSVVCNQIHLPVQAGSDAVLKAMNRRYTAEHYLNLLDKLRHAMPDIGVSSDFIVGFPGETEEDFALTLELVERARLNSAFTFKYSRRTGTPAAAAEQQVPEEVKRERLSRLNALQLKITAELDAAMVGREERVLVESLSRRRTTQVTGRTEGGKTVNLNGGEELIGRVVPVRITKAMANTLTGQLL